jgi:hypothetical protein
MGMVLAVVTTVMTKRLDLKTTTTTITTSTITTTPSHDFYLVPGSFFDEGAHFLKGFLNRLVHPPHHLVAE